MFLCAKTLVKICVVELDFEMKIDRIKLKFSYIRELNKLWTFYALTLHIILQHAYVLTLTEKYFEDET